MDSWSKVLKNTRESGKDIFEKINNPHFDKGTVYLYKNKDGNYVLTTKELVWIDSKE